MKKLKEIFFTRTNLIIALFVVFVFLRLFTGSSSVLLAADNLKYLETAKNFPYHTLYNNQLYLLHPPFYPYTIYLFTLIIQEDYIAAIVISLLSSLVTFFVLYKFFMMLTGNFNTTFLVLFFFTLSVQYIKIARTALSESFVIMLILLSLYYYVRGIKFNDKKSIVASSALSIILAFTSDHIIFLLPALILSYTIFSGLKISIRSPKFPNLRYIIIPLALILISYGSWNAIKFYQYYHNEYYPNGTEGAPISTDDTGLLQLISPHYFKDWIGSNIATGAIPTFKKLIFNFGYMFNIQPFSIPPGLNLTSVNFLLYPKHVAYMLLIYAPLAVTALYGFFSISRNLIKTMKVHNNFNLYAIGLFFIFLIPITQKITSPRYIYTSYFFLFYFISYGLDELSTKTRMLRVYSKIPAILAIFLLLLAPFWYYNNSHFVLFSKKVFGTQNTANFINDNIRKEDVIMAQPGYSVKLIYLTGHRIVGLYPKPENLLRVINYYNISYVVFGRTYTYDVFNYYLDSVEFVKNNPDKFELISAIPEDYSDFYAEGDPKRTDEVYIYKVKK